MTTTHEIHDSQRRAQAVRRLLERAESYGRDGSTLRREGDTTTCVIYETIASELRAVAVEVAR